jgi:uncharacterized protein YvpB
VHRSSFPRTRSRRRLLRELLSLAAAGPAAAIHPFAAAAQQGVSTPDGRYYDAYVPAATKEGQFHHYTCEFDAAWVVLETFGHDVGFEEQLAIVGHDMSVVPTYEEVSDGTFVIYGGDITTAFNGDYYEDFLARTTGQAMLPLFQHYGLDATPVHSREGIEATLNQGGLVWMKATADFLPWADTTWVTPNGLELPTVLGNDHAVVVMGYNEYGPVIRDVLGPTSSNWNRVYEYDVPWETFLGVFNAQGADGIGVLPPGAAPRNQTIQSSAQDPVEAARDAVRVCC